MALGQNMHSVFQFGLCEQLPEVPGQTQRNFGATCTVCVLVDPSKDKTGFRLGKRQKRRISSCALSCYGISPLSFPFLFTCWVFLENSKDVLHAQAMSQSPDSQVPAWGTISPSVPHVKASFLCKWMYTGSCALLKLLQYGIILWPWHASSPKSPEFLLSSVV